MDLLNIIGNILIFGLVLYGFWDMDKNAKKFQLLSMLSIATRLTELEGRMSSGNLRSESECEESQSRYAQAIQEVNVHGKLINPL